MSRTARLLVLALVTALAAAGCALIPPQDIGDVFGLDGRTVEAQAVTSGSGLSAQQFTSCADPALPGTHCASFTSEPFDDPDVPGIATSIIAGLSVDAGVDASMTATGILPAQITVEGFALSLTLVDLETGTEVDFAAQVTPAEPVVFASEGGAYVASDVSPLDMTIEVDSDLGAVKSILTGGGQNQASGVVVLDVAEGGIATLDVTLASDGATISF